MSDIVTLRRMLDARLTQLVVSPYLALWDGCIKFRYLFHCRYEHSHGVEMSGSAVSQLLSVTLYYRRFFPYYAFCMVGSLDENGE